MSNPAATGHFAFFCRRHKVTADERRDLARFLALLRYEATIRELTPIYRKRKLPVDT
jgi:hypothetical protein